VSWYQVFCCLKGEEEERANDGKTAATATGSIECTVPLRPLDKWSSAAVNTLSLLVFSVSLPLMLGG
jgi:hypothetical protein